MNKATRDNLRTLLVQATPGDWQMTHDPALPEDVRVCRIVDGQCVVCVGLMGDFDYEHETWASATIDRWRGDAQIIATMRNRLPELLDQIDRYERALEAAKVPHLAACISRYTNMAGTCDCGTFQHNAAIDAALSDKEQLP